MGALESNPYVLSLCTSGTTTQGSGTTAWAVEHRDRSKTKGEAKPNERHYRWSQRYYRWPQWYCRLAQRYYYWTAHNAYHEHREK